MRFTSDRDRIAFHHLTFTASSQSFTLTWLVFDSHHSILDQLMILSGICSYIVSVKSFLLMQWKPVFPWRVHKHYGPCCLPTWNSPWFWQRLCFDVLITGVVACVYIMCTLIMHCCASYPLKHTAYLQLRSLFVKFRYHQSYVPLEWTPSSTVCPQ